jgi:hypothetical protein
MVYPSLATLSVNRRLMSDFLSAETPCFALGMVEERRRPCGFLALRPDEVIPPGISNAGLLAGCDIAVVSGLPDGIDTAAHTAAMKQRGGRHAHW